MNNIEEEEECEFQNIDGDYYCTVHKCTMVGKQEPIFCVKNKLHPNYEREEN